MLGLCFYYYDQRSPDYVSALYKNWRYTLLNLFKGVSKKSN